jgi:hypothetical protein
VARRGRWGKEERMEKMAEIIVGGEKGKWVKRALSRLILDRMEEGDR